MTFHDLTNFQRRYFLIISGAVTLNTFFDKTGNVKTAALRKSHPVNFFWTMMLFFIMFVLRLALCTGWLNPQLA